MKATIASVLGQGTRLRNEDWLEHRTENGAHLLLLCDGVGGNSGGEQAAKGLARAAAEGWTPFGEPLDSLTGSILIGARALEQERDRLGHTMGMMTTVVGCSVTPHGRIAIAHTGDSRAYLFHGNRIRYQTKDHSTAQRRIDRGESRKKDVRQSHHRHRLYQLVDADWDVGQLSVFEGHTLRKGDAVLLCSDGFWEFVSEQEMQRTLRRATNAQEWLDRMMAVWTEHASAERLDNYSAIAWIAEEG